MRQVFNSGGEIIVADIPAPSCGDNEVLVQNIFSVISSGTEVSSLKDGGKGILSLAKKATTNFKLVQKAIDFAKGGVEQNS